MQKENEWLFDNNIKIGTSFWNWNTISYPFLEKAGPKENWDNLEHIPEIYISNPFIFQWTQIWI